MESKPETKEKVESKETEETIRQKLDKMEQ